MPIPDRYQIRCLNGVNALVGNDRVFIRLKFGQLLCRERTLIQLVFTYDTQLRLSGARAGFLF